MQVRICSTPERASRAVARRIAETIRSKPDLALGLAAGRTPVPVYEELVRIFRRGQVDFSRATVFSLDEFLGLARTDPRSFHAFLCRHLLAHVNVPPTAVHTLNGTAADPDRECRRYERLVRRTGGIDLQLLGLGTNAHIAFNEPGKWLYASTHRARLRSATRQANADLFGGRVAAVPRRGLSMGVGTIMSARQIILLATGRAKAAAAAQMISGRCTTEAPASLLQLHPNIEVFLDGEAASKLLTQPLEAHVTEVRDLRQ